MPRPRYIDPEAFAAGIPTGLPEDEWRRQLAETIRAAVVASGGAVQIHRACEVCGKMMRLGGRLWDSGSNGYVTRRMCSDVCRQRAKRKRAAASA